MSPRTKRPAGQGGAGNQAKHVDDTSFSVSDQAARVLRALRKNHDLLVAGDVWHGPNWDFARRLLMADGWEGLWAVEAERRCAAVFAKLGDKLPFRKRYTKTQLAEIRRRFPDAGLWVFATGVTDSKTRYDDETKWQDPKQAFLAAWERMSPSPLAEAAARARRYPEDFFGDALRGLPGFRKFLALCRELGLDGDSFPLSVESFADVLETDKRTVSGWKRKAEVDGSIVKVTDAVPNRKSCVYIWLEPEPPYDGDGPPRTLRPSDSETSKTLRL